MLTENSVIQGSQTTSPFTLETTYDLFYRLGMALCVKKR